MRSVSSNQRSFHRKFNIWALAALFLIFFCLVTFLAKLTLFFQQIDDESSVLDSPNWSSVKKKSGNLEDNDVLKRRKVRRKVSEENEASSLSTIGRNKRNYKPTRNSLDNRNRESEEADSEGEKTVYFDSERRGNSKSNRNSFNRNSRGKREKEEDVYEDNNVDRSKLIGQDSIMERKQKRSGSFNSRESNDKDSDDLESRMRDFDEKGVKEKENFERNSVIFSHRKSKQLVKENEEEEEEEKEEEGGTDVLHSRNDNGLEVLNNVQVPKDDYGNMKRVADFVDSNEYEYNNRNEYPPTVRHVSKPVSKFPDFVITSDNFADVIARVSDDVGELIFTTFSIEEYDNGTLEDDFENGMTSFNYNWVFHLKKSGVENFLLVGMSEAACTPSRERGIPCYVNTFDWLEDAEIIRGRQVVLKWLYMKKMVDLGYNPIFLDNDAILLQNPFKFWNRSYDFQGVADTRPENGELSKFAIHFFCGVGQTYGTHYPCLSTGVMFVRSTETTKLFLEHFVAELEEKESSVWEQALFQHRVVAFLIQVGDGPPPLKLRILPFENYHNVDVLYNRRISGLPINSIIVHCGFIHGGYNKRRALKLLKLWREE